MVQAKQSWDPEPRSFWTPAPSFWVGQERTLGVSFPLAWGIRVPLLSEAGTEVGDMLWSGAPCCSSDWREPQPGVRTAAPRLLGPSGAAGAWESVPCAPRPPEVRGPLSWGRAADSELGVRPAWAWALLAALGGLLPSRPGLSGL